MELKSTDHLIHTVLNKIEDRSNYVLFLGAGASWNSGVKTAKEMIESWRRELYERSGSRFRYNTWLNKQSWYDNDDEYGYLFGHLYDEPSHRRDHIEKILENSSPNWGYVYLANLLHKHIFNAVFTTNFDDLINEACYLYTDGKKPVVCAHDSQALSIRLTRTRPQIIKLHGDFLFEDIKNTNEETDKLTLNMENKFTQFGQEYGLVVMGYGGRDNSIMSILTKLVTNKGYFRDGIYWCIRKGEKPRPRVQALLDQDKRVHAIEIQGFDEFMAELHSRAGLELPQSVINPMKVAEQRSNIFCSVPKQLLDNTIIRKDIEKVLDGLGKMGTKVEGKYSPPDEMPLKLKAAIMKRKGYKERAAEYLKLAIAENKDDPNCSFDYASILAELNKKKSLKDFIPISSIDEENKTYFLLFTDDNEAVIKQANEVIIKSPSSLIARVNRAIAYKRLNQLPELEKDLKSIEESNPDEAIESGIAALRKDKVKMLRLLDIAVSKKLISTEHLKIFPVFEDYHNDHDFIGFIQDRETSIGK